MTFAGRKVALIGPMPPPEGGMANQTRQLAELLRRDGVTVTVVPSNMPYRPRWIGSLRGVRAGFRLIPYLLRLWREASRVDLFHIMANSGWSWHLFAAPAVWIAFMRGVPSVVNYRGGEAEVFLLRSGPTVLKTLRRASVTVVPSPFLEQVFGRRGVACRVVPNIIDGDRFRPALESTHPASRQLVVARNLEPIYDLPTAMRAFALVRRDLPDARLAIAGSGPERERLEALARELGIDEAVDFCGRLDRDRMAQLYRSASVALNPSLVDNMPNSVLEAMASGVPVVSTNVGGVPCIVSDGVTGLLFPPGDHREMARLVRRVLEEPGLANGLREAALADVQRFTWPRVRQQWLDVYESVVTGARVEARPA